jgi:hypothetical protein
VEVDKAREEAAYGVKRILEIRLPEMLVAFVLDLIEPA